MNKMKHGLICAIMIAGSMLFGQVEVTGDITTNTTWFADTEYHLTGQTFVVDGVTLTIEPGTVIKAYPDDGNGLAPALVIERGGTVIADGTADAPITFTSILPADQLPARGQWGGLILLGNAPISTTGGENFVEGLTGVPYGGDDPDDSSGILRYVRVWYGGSSIGLDNEINGVTLAGVGRGTTVDHVEVAWNLDDGFEMFGGTVDLTHCSVLFVGDDAFDTDEGYQGRGQFLFAMVGETDGNRAHEMDSKTNGDLDSQPRSHPQFSNVTVVGSGHDDPAADNDQMLRLREGTGGDFRNYIVIDGKEFGLRNSDNGSEVVTSDWATAEAAGYPNYLYWSANNIITGCPSGQFHGDYGLGALDADPLLASLDGREVGGIIDPRPVFGGPAYENVDDVPEDDFFVQTDFKGAFGGNLWLRGWSWLDHMDRLPVLEATEICGDIEEDLTLFEGELYHLTCQTFVKEGVTLTIQPGVTVQAYPDDGQGLAPALVIERGATIIADGTREMPITFTSILPEDQLPARGQWGGLILLGNAPISTTAGENFVEGITGVPYGGDDPDDSSGILRFVRVWYGGRSIGLDNEINGITLAGVGRGTVVENCEVAWNLDDGFEMFGGTVDLKYCSVLFVGDDAFDTDEGYQGRGQYLFAVVGEQDGNRAHEMDNKTNGNLDSQPRSHPIWANVTVVGSGHDDPAADNDQMLRLREGTGGDFRNYVVYEGKEYGLRNSDNGSEMVTSDWDEAQAAGYPNYLYWSPNNIIFSCPSGQFHGDYGLGAMDADPLFNINGREVGGVFDPRPANPDSPVYDNVDPVHDDGWFEPVDFKGAFDQYWWLEGYSWLAEAGRAPEHVDDIVDGDLTEDGSVDVLDVVNIVSIILQNTDMPDNWWVADMNFDGNLDILDVVLMVDAILTGYNRAEDAGTATVNDVDGRVSLEADGFVGGIQMTVKHDGDINLNLNDDAFLAQSSTHGNQTTIVIVHPQNELFTYTGDMEITNMTVVSSSDYIDASVVDTYQLLNSYPNPFNPTTTISYSVPAESFVSLTVYDIMGHKVTDLVSSPRAAGSYQAIWNGTDASGISVATGIYLVQLNTISGLSTQKVTLLK